VNVEAGARTQLASLLAMAVVVLALNILTNFFYFIPMASLAAMIIVAVMMSMDIDVYRNAYKMPLAVSKQCLLRIELSAAGLLKLGMLWFGGWDAGLLRADGHEHHHPHLQR
jgi:hypothetical protein